MAETLIRTVCFSHSEPYLKRKGVKDNFQVVIRVDEYKNKRKFKFFSEIIIFNATKFTCENVDRKYLTLEDASADVSRIFDCFENFKEPPELLHLPQWSEPSKIKAEFSKWTDRIFGQNRAYI